MNKSFLIVLIVVLAAPSWAVGLPLLQVQPAPGQEAEDTAGEEPSSIELDLIGVGLQDVIRIIGDALELNYIIDPGVGGTVNIGTSVSLLRSDLLPILETLLKINGATMVQNGNFYEIVPAGAGVEQPLVIQDGVLPQAPDDQMVIQILRMRYVPATEMSALLTPYLGEGGNITVHAVGNILMLTERRSNLRKLLEIVAIFDSDVFENERVRLLPVTNALASDLIGDLETIFSGYAFSNSSAIRFVPIGRLNSIMVVTPNASVFAEVETWLRQLDQPLQTSGITNFVYKVRNGRAIDIQRVLTQLYSDLPPPFNPSTGGIPVPNPSILPTDAVPPEADPSVGTPGGLSNSRGVRIIADEVNNALVIQATAQMYAEIERTILELDLLPRQVLIDAQIFEVNLDDSLSLGLMASLQNRGTLTNPMTTIAFASGPGGGTPSLTAQTFGFVGRTRELVAFLNASENRSRVRTLSAPSVMVSDNMVAQFQVGAEIPIPTTSSVTPIQSDGTNLFAQTITFRTTGVILNVRPQINEGGMVTLEIVQEVSQAGTNTTSDIAAPVIGKAAVSSTIVVQDGQTIVLGGFIRENQERAQSRIPVIGRIPGLGALFGNTRRATTRSELVILITPHVIRNFDEAQLATDELRGRLEEIQEMLQ